MIRVRLILLLDCYSQGMRVTLTILGFATIAVYSIVGAILMNDWAVVAASEVPLASAIAAMDAAGQP